MTDSMVERVARALCAANRHNPDALEPGDVHGIDGYMRNGDPAHFLWREWEGKARSAIEAMREPTNAMIDATNDIVDCEGSYEAWQAMIDAALTPSHTAPAQASEHSAER